jgi:hypothetical protein
MAAPLSDGAVQVIWTLVPAFEVVTVAIEDGAEEGMIVVVGEYGPHPRPFSALSRNT